jgi:hypothetical protein
MRLSRFVACLAVALALSLGIAYALRQRPVLFHVWAETDCACGDYHEDVTGLRVLNPFRDLAPEQSATTFLEELRNGQCTAVASLCQYALVEHRVSEWRLANRQDRNDRVLLYYKLTKYATAETKYSFTGEGLIEVVRTQSGWEVANYSSYF